MMFYLLKFRCSSALREITRRYMWFFVGFITFDGFEEASLGSSTSQSVRDFKTILRIWSNFINQKTIGWIRWSPFLKIVWKSPKLIWHIWPYHHRISGTRHQRDHHRDIFWKAVSLRTFLTATSWNAASWSMSNWNWTQCLLWNH